ncbi:MAG: phosphopantetheine-binding protein [Nonlabens sp.]
MSIEKKIHGLLKEHFASINEIENIDSNTPLITSGVLDSISLLRLVDILETKFEIAFKAHEIDRDKFNSISLIKDTISAKMK